MTRDLKVFTSELLNAANIAHGFFSRHGGVSQGIYASLNCGRGSKDERAHVEENRKRAAGYFQLHSEALIGPKQVHSPNVIVVGEPWPASAAPEGDAVVTANRGLALCVLTADCTPILLADAKAQVIGAIHAGWKGAKAGVIEKTVEAMESLGASRASIKAAIGPTLSQQAYEVGPEFEEAFMAETPANTVYFTRASAEDRPYFNLPSYVINKLRRCSIGESQDLELCTYANDSLFFSHRRSVHAKEGDYGRQIAAITLL